MRVARDFAGYSMGQADTIRKAVSKKNAEDLAKLGVDDRLDVMAVSLARSVATYLTARANNNANISAQGAAQ